MGKNRRVVVTGMGAITPIGNSVEEFWNGIKEGKTGFGPITYFDTADYRCKLAAEVKDFDPTQYMDKKSARRMEQFCQFAVAAAGQAIARHEPQIFLRALHRLHGSAQILGITALQQLCAPFEAKRPDSLTPASCLEVVQHITGVMREIDGEINALIGR